MYEFNTNQTVELYRKTDAQRDKFGQVLTNWTLVADLFADLRFKTGKEQISSAIIEETASGSALVHEMAQNLLSSVEKLNTTAEVLDNNMDGLKTEIAVFKI